MVMRPMRWAEMDEAARAALCARGLGDIFDPALRASIVTLIEDVRARGDAAVCEALARFDGITLAPSQLRVTADEIAVGFGVTRRRRRPRRRHRPLPGVQRAAHGACRRRGASSRSLDCASVRRSARSRRPGCSSRRARPATRASPTSSACRRPWPGCPRSSSSCRRSRAATDPSTRPCSSSAASSASTDVFRVNGPAGLAALAFGTESIPKVRKVVGPGSPAVTCAQVELQRHGVVTMMVLGPTESLVIADDSADPVRLAADLLIEAEHGTDSAVVLVTTSADLAAATDAELARQLADLPAVRADAATGVARHERRLRARRRPRRGRRRRQPLRPRAPPGRRRRPMTSTPSSTRWSTPARSSSASTPRSAPPTSSSAARHRCRRPASPRSRRASPSRRSSSAPPSPVPMPARSPACRRRSSPSPTTRDSRPTPRRSAAAA